jgi:hypothetical protein
MLRDFIVGSALLIVSALGTAVWTAATGESANLRLAAIVGIVAGLSGGVAYGFGWRHGSADPALKQLLDELSSSLVNVENAVGALRSRVPADAPQKAWAAAYAIRDQARASSSRLDAATAAMLDAFAESALEAVYRSEQMSSPGTNADPERDQAEALIRYRLFQRVASRRGALVDRFRTLRRLSRAPLERRRGRTATLRVTAIAEGRVVYLRVRNRRGRAIIRATAVSSLHPAPYPLLAKTGKGELSACGPFGGGDFLLARTTAWDGWTGRGQVPGNYTEKITLPSADGSDAVRWIPWNPRKEDDDIIWREPVATVEVFFETDPPLKEPLRRIYRVCGVRDDPVLTVEDISR